MNLNLELNLEFFLGEKIVENKKEKLKSLGKKAIIVTNDRSETALSEVVKILDKINTKYCIFDEISTEASYEKIKKGCKIGQLNNVDYIIGVGDETIISASKTISLMLKNDEILKEDLFNRRDLEGLPILCIPTMFGFGNEVNQFAIIVDEKNQTKRMLKSSIYPKMTMLDVRYIQKLTTAEAKDFSMRALTNIIEGYLMNDGNKDYEKMAIEGLNKWGECIDDLLRGKINEEDIENLYRASILGGVLVSRNGLSILHKMGDEIGYVCSIPNGIAKGVIYEAYLDKFKNEKKINNIINVLGFSTLKDLKKTINKLTRIDLNISDNKLSNISKNVVKYNYREKVLDKSEIFNIYKNSIINKKTNYDTI